MTRTSVWNCSHWRGLEVTELRDAIDRDPKTISRTVKGQTAPSIETVVRICIGFTSPNNQRKADGGSAFVPKADGPKHQWIKEALYLSYPESLDASH